MELNILKMQGNLRIDVSETDSDGFVKGLFRI